MEAKVKVGWRASCLLSTINGPGEFQHMIEHANLDREDSLQLCEAIDDWFWEQLEKYPPAINGQLVRSTVPLALNFNVQITRTEVPFGQ